MKTKATLLLSGALLAAPLAPAATSQVSPSGYLVTHRATVKARPPQVFAAFPLVSLWWDPEHTYSGDSQRLRLEPRAGGCFCETWEGGSIEHARVIYAATDKALRLEGALGPLQEMAVQAILQFKLEKAGDDTAVTLTYRVRGTAEAALDKTAAPVDRVLGEQLKRLARYVETGATGPQAALRAPPGQFFASAGARLRYVAEGSRGDPVVLLHDEGTGLESQWVETGVLRALAGSHRVIALDLRGHGKSEKAPGDGAAMARDVTALLDHLEIGRAHLVGYGLGAAIAAYLAVHEPRRLITMTLAGGAQAPRGAAGPFQGLAVSDEQMRQVAAPTLGLVATGDPAVGHLLALRRVMPRLVRMVTIEGENHATAPRNPEFALSVAYFLRYHPAELVK